MAYTLGNKCDKNCCKQTIPVQLIVEDVVTCYFGTQCRIVKNEMFAVFVLWTQIVRVCSQ